MSYIKAPLGERFVANFIDSMIMGTISMATFFYAWPVGILLSYLYLLVMDGLNFDFMDGRSIGKKIMNLRPVRLNGEPMNLPTSVKRNFLRLFPLINLVDAGMVFNDEHNRRLGDKIADTIVVVDD